jgi:DNA helicase-2/ATP-dependent DNA helicase PcrA
VQYPSFLSLILLKTFKARMEANLDIITRGLNDKQKEAVLTKNGPLIIIAGAGSGKTKVITQRIAHLLATGVKPWNILALTFTNKAAKELKSRIARIVGEEIAEKVWAGTFHSIFARILRIEAEEIGFTSSFTIFDADDQLSAIKNVMNILLIAQQTTPPQQVRSKISAAKNQMIDVDTFKQNAKSTLDKQTGLIFETYEKYLKDNNAMDFDDLLLNTIKLLEKSQAVLSKYQERFRYILVDEYQDTNRAQYRVVNLLAKAHQNICVVGDDAQSIYKWRGADIRNILDFERDYPYTKIVKLEQNYRSTKNILKAADSVIKNNKNQLPKDLWTDNIEGEKVEVIACADERDEANKIISLIKSSIVGDLSYKDFAVLYRTNAQALALENALRTANIPYVVVGGLSFFKRKEIKDITAYFRLLINKKDNEALQRVINEPPRGIGNTTMQYVRDYAIKKEISLYEAFSEAEQITGLQQRAVTAIKKFTEFVETYSAFENVEDVADYLSQFIEATGLTEMYRELGTDDANDRWNNIQQVISDISIYFKTNTNANLVEYIQQIALMSDYDEKNTSSDQITIMTLHTAKGLEYNTVFLAGLEHGLFPMVRDKDDDIEEERRLMYVGITRAEKKLFISYANKRMRFGQTELTSPSKFLYEIDADVLDWAEGKRLLEEKERRQNNLLNGKFNYSQGRSSDNYSQIPKSYGTAAPATAEQKTTVFPFKVGDRVKHKVFGEGIISGLKGVGDMRQATVNFYSVGKKDFMLKFAGLVKVG